MIGCPDAPGGQYSCTRPDGHTGLHHGHSGTRPDGTEVCFATWDGDGNMDKHETSRMCPGYEDPDNAGGRLAVTVEKDPSRVVINSSGLRLYVREDQLDDLIVDLMRARERLVEAGEWYTSSNPNVRHVSDVLMLTVLRTDDEFYWQLVHDDKGELAWGDCEGFEQGRQFADAYWEENAENWT